MQVTIARQLGLDPSTVSNFFMNARRRSVDKWREDSPPGSLHSPGGLLPHSRTLLVTSVSSSSSTSDHLPGATLVQHIAQSGQLSPTSISAEQLDL